MWEVAGNSVERVQDYLVIETEKENTPKGVPPAYWPASGDIRIENLSARYSPDSPIVLDSINISIKSGERIGVVGTWSARPSTERKRALTTVSFFRPHGKWQIDARPRSPQAHPDHRRRIH